MTIPFMSAGMTEEEMRDAEKPWPKTHEELRDYIESVVDRPHDYGTCVHAIALSAVATFNYVASRMGATGFQASCANMEFMRHVRNWQWGAILDYENLLYPQYAYKFKGYLQLLEEHRYELGTRAAALLVEQPKAHQDVIAHWERLVENAKDRPTGGDEVGE